jgi:large subunit ribosomal protein L17
VSEPKGDTDAQDIVADVFNPDDERQDYGNVTPEPTAQNTAVVDDPALSPEVADAAAAEINAAETTDAATASTHAPGGDAAPDPK